MAEADVVERSERGQGVLPVVRSDLIEGFLALAETLPRPSILCRSDGIVVAGNAAAREALDLGFDGPGGSRRPSAIGSNGFLPFLQRASRTRGPIPGAAEVRCRDGVVRRYQLFGGVYQPASGDNPALVVVHFRPQHLDDSPFAALNRQIAALHAEIRERAAVQQRLEHALEDREVLLREVHHRVKNNLQLVLSLLDMGSAQEQAGVAAPLLQQAKDRIRAMAVVENLLFASEEYRHIEGAVLLGNVVAGIEQGYGRPEVKLRLALEPVPLGIDSAIAIGMIVTELLSNAYRHAFPDGRSGEIRVALRHAGETVEIEVADNGVGPAGPEVVERRPSGLRIVEALVRQVHGERVSIADSGMRHMIRMPLPRDDEATAGAAAP